MKLIISESNFKCEIQKNKNGQWKELLFVKDNTDNINKIKK